MKLPETIRVGGLTYHLSASKEDERALKTAGLDGQCRSYPRVISVCRSLEPESFHRAVVHELLHAVDSSILNHQVKEEEIQGLAVGLGEILWNLGTRFEYPDTKRGRVPKVANGRAVDRRVPKGAKEVE